MTRCVVVVLACLPLLAACGANKADRALSGGAMGAGIGILGGPIGVLVGAGAGAAAGALTNPEQVDLGEPVWRR